LICPTLFCVLSVEVGFAFLFLFRCLLSSIDPVAKHIKPHKAQKQKQKAKSCKVQHTHIGSMFYSTWTISKVRSALERTIDTQHTTHNHNHGSWTACHIYIDSGLRVPIKVHAMYHNIVVIAILLCTCSKVGMLSVGSVAECRAFPPAELPKDGPLIQSGKGGVCA
jgi:hypothetical protein